MKAVAMHQCGKWTRLALLIYVGVRSDVKSVFNILRPGFKLASLAQPASLATLVLIPFRLLLWGMSAVWKLEVGVARDTSHASLASSDLGRRPLKCLLISLLTITFPVTN